MADGALYVFFSLTKAHPWAPLVLAPVIGMVTVWATRKYFAGSQGSGIPQVIAATRNAKLGRAVDGLVSLRIACGKILLGCFALVGGFSAGREGPSVQVASSILHFSHRFLPHARAIRAEDLILAGGAAGVAAAFNTPLAGIVFAVEELGRRLETRTSGVLISTIILSGLVSIALLGNYNYFGRFSAADVSLAIVLPVLVCGVVCGWLGGLFSQILLWPQRRPGFVLWRWRTEHPVKFAGLCGLAVALVGLGAQGLSFGSGYAITQQVVTGELALPWYAAAARYLATLLTYFSGIPGGIFAPSLAVGAAMGANLAPLFPGDGAVIPVITLCMTAFLAAVTQSPITAAIIVMEMVDGHGMVLSLMAVALIARAVSSRLGPELYQQLAVGFLRDDGAAPTATAIK
ncbi:MAG: chloride channel protein [Rhodocyclaceae bacterium]|nr:MAG: chloride channel protein [Rhodocyclaceae bacterium]